MSKRPSDKNNAEAVVADLPWLVQVLEAKLAAQQAEASLLREKLDALSRESDLRRCVNKADTLDDLLDEIVQYLEDRWGFDSIGVQLVDSRRQVICGYRYRGTRELPPQTLELASTELPLDPAVSLSARVAVEQRVLYFHRQRPQPCKLTELDVKVSQELGLVGALVAPIVEGGSTVGVVHLGMRQEDVPLSERELAELTEFLASLGVPIHRMQSRERLEAARLEQERLARLCQRISQTIKLPELLDTLGDEIDRLRVFDGFYIALPDTEAGILACRKIQLPGQYRSLEGAYDDMRYLLDSDEAMVRVFHGNRRLVLDAAELEKHPARARHGIDRWSVDALAILPISLGTKAAGVVFGFTQKRELNEALLQELEQLLPLFAEQIRNAQFFSELARQEQEIRTASTNRQRFLEVVGHLVELRDAEQIYQVITDEFLQWLPFDLAGIVMREDDKLVVKKNAVRDESLVPMLNAWDEFYSRTHYTLDIADGATSYVYVKDSRVIIRDVRQVLELPMSRKDREALELVGTPRTFCLVPLRRRGEPVGVLWLVSVRQVVELPESDLRLVEAVCSVIGTAIENAEVYSTVGRQRRQIEQALTDLQETQVELARAKDTAEASAAAKSVFIANTSHEIRTPLTAIIGFAEQLLESAQPGTDAASSADIILRNGRHLLGLINDILDLSKIEAGRMEFERIAYAPLELLRDVASTVAVQAREKGLYFRVNFFSALPAQLTGDPVRVRQVLINLCNNAIKFTRRGGVEVDVECDARNSGLRLAVRDTGIGIRREDRERLFQPFTQADASTTRRYGGTGLGLPITRQLVEGMGGRLELRSVPGQGSTFEVWLPTGALDGVEWLRSPSLEHDLHALGPVERRRVNGHVLVAEDGVDNQRLILMYLGSVGATTTLVENGEEAVEAALRESYDLILMDIQMPVLSGLDAVIALRQAGYSQPIVALTANVMSGDVSRYHAAGFDGCLAKPIERTTFFRTLERYLTAPEEPSVLLRIDLGPLIARFTEELPGRLADLQQRLEAEDWEGLAAEAHKLKGTAGALGWPQLGALAGEIENTLRQTAPGPARLEKLGELIRLALQCLQKADATS